MALAQPTQITTPPPEGAPSPATQGYITHAAADSDSRAAASRQSIGVVQASLVLNRALPAVPPSMQAPGPSTALGAPTTLEDALLVQQAATAGPAEAKPSASSSSAPSASQRAASIAEAPRGDDAVVSGPQFGGVGEVPAVQTLNGEPVAVPLSGEVLLGDNAAFFSTTDVLEPAASTPDNSTSTGLVKVSFKSQALTSQLYRAAQGSGEPPVLHPLAAVYAPAPVGQVQPSPYGDYSRTVEINVAHAADQAAQAPALSATVAAPILDNAGGPDPVIAGLQPQMGASDQVAAAPGAAGSSLATLSPAMPAHETAR